MSACDFKGAKRRVNPTILNIFNPPAPPPAGHFVELDDTTHQVMLDDTTGQVILS